jgi:hypothetical protein
LLIKGSKPQVLCRAMADWAALLPDRNVNESLIIALDDLRSTAGLVSTGRLNGFAGDRAGEWGTRLC